MPKAKSYHLALEIDRTLNLSLDNGLFECLVAFIDGYQDGQNIAKNIMRGNSKEVLALLKALKK